MDGQDFLKTARRLLTGSDESDWRSAVSRAYYAMFHMACDLCRAHGLDLGQGGQVHHNLYVGLNNCGQPIVHGLAARLDALRDDRTDADYDLASMMLHTRAVTCVQEADAIIVEFQAILTTIPAQSIIDGAKQHLQLIGRIPKTP